MRGTYVFKQDGKIVAECPNLITTAGHREILRYLAQQRRSFAGSIALGHGQTAPTLQDTDLVLESVRLDIGVSSPDFLTGNIVYKATIPQLTIGTYYEVGIWSSTAVADLTVQPLLTFADLTEDWSGGTHSAANARFSNSTLLVSAATNTSTNVINSNFSISFAEYLNRDTIALAFYVTDQNCDLVRIRFLGEDTANYFEYVQNDVSLGYNVVKFNTSQLTKVGVLDLSQIKSVQLIVKANTVDIPTGLGYTGTRVYFDVLAYKPFNDETNILISRAVVPEVVKLDTTPLDVEYYLDLDVI